ALDHRVWSSAIRSPHCFILVPLPSPGPHRQLHSFPTRRSSDLPEVQHAFRRFHREVVVLPRAQVPPAAHDGFGLVHRFPHLGLRSEEHTSELQSPYDLVCRLLLEKKKKDVPRRFHADCCPRRSL